MKPGRLKWEPLALMALLVLLGAWLVYRPDPISGPDGATFVEFRWGGARGWVERSDGPEGEMVYRIRGRDGRESEPMAETEFRQRFGWLADEFEAYDRYKIFKLFNITNWVSLIWITIGLGGQIVFSSRFLIQWIVSERQRESVIPDIFWWISLLGGLCLFVYFVWRRDIVGVLGQSSGIVIYARNIRLIHKKRSRDARAASVANEGT
ncbi:MAG: lipid-A-disaccharide synthase N-terminal domain-containing protein [Phycisphaerales bacterium JB039]